MTDNIYITPPKDIQVENILFDPQPSKLNNGGTMVYVKRLAANGYDRTQLYVLQPEMFSPFGLNKFNFGGRESWSITLSFGGMDDKPIIAQLHDLYAAMDDLALEMGVVNQAKWFKPSPTGQPWTKNELAIRYKPLLVQSNPPGQYAPQIKFNAKDDEKGNFPFIVLDASQQRLEVTTKNAEEIIPPKSRLAILVEFPSLWFTGSGWGWSKKLQQVAIAPSYVPRQSQITQPIALSYTEDGDIEMDEPTVSVH